MGDVARRGQAIELFVSAKVGFGVASRVIQMLSHGHAAYNATLSRLVSSSGVLTHHIHSLHSPRAPDTYLAASICCICFQIRPNSFS
jgi:hypothetical protein